MTYFAIDPRGCARAEGEFQLALVSEDGTRLRMSDASKVEPSFVRWSGLEPGTYVLVVGKMPEGYISYSLDGFICCSANEGYEITIGEDQLIDGTLYLFQEAFGVGAPPPPTQVPVAQPTQQAVNPSPGVDSDGDGLSDELEVNVFGTSPFLVDSDGDTFQMGSRPSEPTVGLQHLLSPILTGMGSTTISKSSEALTRSIPAVADRTNNRRDRRED